MASATSGKAFGGSHDGINTSQPAIGSVSKVKLAAIKTEAIFRDLLPRLTDDERQRLHDRIKQNKEVIRLTVWKERGILIDGHHALEYILSHPDEFAGIEPDIVEESLPDEEAVIEWMIMNQLGRRNLLPALNVEMALRLKPKFTAPAREHQAGGVRLEKNEGVQPIDALAEVAKIAGTSRSTVHKVETVLEHASQELQDAMRAGQTSITTAAKVATAPLDVQQEVVEASKVSKTAAAHAAQRFNEGQQDAGAEVDPANGSDPTETQLSDAPDEPQPTGKSKPRKRDKSPFLRSAIADIIGEIQRPVHDFRLNVKRGRLYAIRNMPEQLKVLSRASRELAEAVELLTTGQVGTSRPSSRSRAATAGPSGVAAKSA